MRPLVKLEGRVEGSPAEGVEGLQGEVGAGRAVQRRRVGEAGDAAWDEMQLLLRTNAEVQAQAVHGMEKMRVLGEELQRAKAGMTEVAAELKVKDIIIQSKDDQLQAKDREMHSKDLLLQAKDLILQAKDREISLLLQTKDSELRLPQAHIARLSAESSAGGAVRQPAPEPPARHKAPPPPPQTEPIAPPPPP
jgi:hypothetical protein